MMTQQQAQDILSQWSRPWFNMNGPPRVWLALLDRTRARNSLEAFRRHCLLALIEAAVDRARRAASTRRVPPQQDPMSRLNRLFLMQWTDPVADPRSSVLRATTNVVYCDNSFRENHALAGTLNGPFARVTINLDMTGTPQSVLTDYTANEVRDTRGTITFEQITALASRAGQP
jgi:hypothetical protein